MWTPAAAELPAALKDPSSWFSVRQAFWKIHSRLPDFLASWPRSSKLRPGWSRCSGWSRQTIFASGSLLSPPPSLPSPRLRSWRRAGRNHLLPAPPPPPLPTALLQGSLQAWPSLLGTAVYWTSPEKLAKLLESSAPGSRWLRSMQSPLRKALAPNLNIKVVSGLWALMQRAYIEPVSLVAFHSLLPSHKERPPKTGPSFKGAAGCGKAHPGDSGVSKCGSCRPTPSEVGWHSPVCERWWVSRDHVELRVQT